MSDEVAAQVRPCRELVPGAVSRRAVQGSSDVWLVVRWGSGGHAPAGDRGDEVWSPAGLAPEPRQRRQFHVKHCAPP